MKFTSQRLDGMLNVKARSDVTFLVEGAEVREQPLVLRPEGGIFHGEDGDLLFKLRGEERPRPRFRRRAQPPLQAATGFRGLAKRLL